MSNAISGLHHVTAIGGDPQSNIDFYLRTLGLRLVKTAVNFDDPGTHHLYYGDENGQPGNLLTYFRWRGIRPGRHGNGQATATSFSVPEHSMGWWLRRLETAGVEASAVGAGDEDEAIVFCDPDGLRLSLVADPHGDPRTPWCTPVVPAEYAIRGLHSVTLQVADAEATSRLLTDVLGFRPVGEHRNAYRFAAGDGGPGSLVDVRVEPEARRGMVAGGTVHHIGWRVPDEAAQERWRRELVGKGLRVTAVIDRHYFRSIYFREPSGILLELATDGPGFAVDEPSAEFGRALRLPPWLESQRGDIEAVLPEIELPDENNPNGAEVLACESGG